MELVYFIYFQNKTKKNSLEYERVIVSYVTVDIPKLNNQGVVSYLLQFDIVEGSRTPDQMLLAYGAFLGTQVPKCTTLIGLVVFTD